MVPRKLSVHPRSPNHDADAIKLVDYVSVDGKPIPRGKCYAYDMDMGWAVQLDEKGAWLPKIWGVVTVKEKS